MIHLRARLKTGTGATVSTAPIRNTSSSRCLFLMLAVAPIISMLEVILSFVLGPDLFNYIDGNMASVVTSLFMPIVYATMVGALAQMREFVKESEIYKRERLVNLQVLPYVLSKLWVAAILALYQSFVYSAIHYAVYQMPGGMTEFLLTYLTLYLATFAGMMLGLASSAVAPNANAAPLIVIMLLMPQLTLGGALIPVPDFISGPTSARWAFEALMAISGPGSDIAADPCWSLPEELRNSMTLEDKKANGCRCLGAAIYEENSCRFPGVGQYYDPVLDQPEPAEPPELEPKPADPVIPPAPPEPGKNADNIEMASYLEALKDYQVDVEKIQNDYKARMEMYQASADVYKEKMTQYQKDISEWKIKRNSAVGEAEGLIKTFYNEFAWTYVDKSDTQAYYGKLIRTWEMQGVIIFVLSIITIVLIWRKDRVR
jgi:ABC transport system ATP-binding/permease protein